MRERDCRFLTDHIIMVYDLNQSLFFYTSGKGGPKTSMWYEPRIHKTTQFFPFFLSFKALLRAQSILSLIWHFGEAVKVSGAEQGIAMSLMVLSL